MANTPKSKARAIRASDELWKKVDERAKSDGVSASDVVRAALMAYLNLDPSEISPVEGREDGRKVRSGLDKGAVRALEARSSRGKV